MNGNSVVPDMMRAVVVNGNMDIKVCQKAVAMPRENEVLVRVRRCGVCGSDVPRVLHRVCPVYPTVLGHEFSGEVAALGEQVTRFRPGDRVAGIPLVPCGRCAPCRDGSFGQCASFQFIGTKRDGGWAEYVTVPQENLFPLDQAIDWAQGAFFEPVTVALHALFQLPRPGEGRLVILGAGTIGQLALQCARAMGFAEICALDLDESKLRLARRLGADRCVNTRNIPQLEQLLEESRRGDQLVQVLDCAGVDATVRLAVQLASWHSAVIFVGIPTQDVHFTPAEFDAISRRELMLKGSWMSYSAPFPGREWQEAARLFREKRLDCGPLLEDELTLEQLPDLFRQIKEGRRLQGKILVRP